MELCGCARDRGWWTIGEDERVRSYHSVALADKATRVGLDLSSFVGDDRVEVPWQPPLEHLLDALAERRGVRRVVIDGVNAFTSVNAHPGRLGRFFAALAGELRRLGATMLFTVGTLEVFGPAIGVPAPVAKLRQTRRRGDAAS